MTQKSIQITQSVIQLGILGGQRLAFPINQNGLRIFESLGPKKEVRIAMSLNQNLEEKIEQLESTVQNQISTLASLRKQRPQTEVENYTFHCAETGKEVKLSELFGDRNELIVIHNMGTSCPACTAWADGFNGAYDHLLDKAAFVLTSPDAPAVQKKFKDSRGWRFPVVSHQNTSFATDMGFLGPDQGYGAYRPGASSFKKTAEGKILRVAFTAFGPGDLYFSVPHIFNLLESGSEGWFPKFKYSQ